jgi:lysophospholipase L1-like esterase
MNRFFQTLLIFVPWLFTIAAASACPDVGRLSDYNCDGKAVVVAYGDSLVYGFGDKENENHGGYVLRAQQQLPEATCINEGVMGLRTGAMLSRLRKAFKNPETSALAQNFLQADVIILDVGRNDFWLFESPSVTLRNIKRARDLLVNSIRALGYPAPLVVTAVLMYPNRTDQGMWVKELDKLLVKSGTPEFPADLRFDKVSKKLLRKDNIHPNSKGYQAMANDLVAYLLTDYKTHAARLLGR